jgi:hypothetical protein
MKRSILFGTILSAALATGLSAQTPQTSGAGSSDSQPSAQQVTITGCLKSGDASSSAAGSAVTGATGTAGATDTKPGAAGGGFILANAKPGSSASSTGTAGTAGSTAGSPAGTSGSAAAGATYKLQGGDPSDLSKYANSQVEVSGTLSSASSTGSPTGATASTSASPESGMSSNMPTLRVSSVRQISSSCSQ